MDKKRWEGTTRTHAEHISKLVEEVGEVGSALLKYERAMAAKNPSKAGVKARRAELEEELTHVVFIAHTFRRQL
jgi:NTP pyrophosphatase (non-canonical NTP hydrolase)